MGYGQKLQKITLFLRIEGTPISIIEPKVSKKVLARVKEIIKYRLYYFEGVKKDMGAVADITDLVMPKLEEAKKEGIKEGKLEDARIMLEKGYPLTDILEITGLSQKQLKKAGLL